MNSNHQWQTQQVNERVQGRMRQAEAHRMLKNGSPRRDSVFARAWNWFRGRSPLSSQKQQQVVKPARRVREARG